MAVDKRLRGLFFLLKQGAARKLPTLPFQCFILLQGARCILSLLHQLVSEALRGGTRGSCLEIELFAVAFHLIKHLLDAGNFPMGVSKASSMVLLRIMLIFFVLWRFVLNSDFMGRVVVV